MDPEPSTRWNRGWRSSLEGVAPIALALISGVSLVDFLQGGLPLFFDAHSHLARTWFAARAFAAWELPTWANDWYGGYRLMEFYSPAYYAITGGLGLLLGDVFAATKYCLWLGQIGTVLALYAFVRRLTRDALLAAFTALLLLASGERMMVLGVVANYPSVFVYVFTPLILLHSLRFDPTRPGAIRHAAGQGLLIGTMALGHLTNTFVVLPGILAFECIWLWQGAPTRKSRVRAASAVVGTLVAVAGITACTTLPMFLSRELVSLSLDLGAPTAGASFEPLEIVTGLVPHSWDRPFVRDHGTLWCALGVAGVVVALLSRDRGGRALAAGLGANLAVLVFLDDRAAIGLAFFLFPLCALALRQLGRAVQMLGVPAAPALTALLGMGFAILWPRAITPPPRYAPIDSFELYTRLPDTPTRSRTFDVTRVTEFLDGFYGTSSFSPYYSKRAIPFGGFPQGAPLANNLILTLLSRMDGELSAEVPVMSNETLDALYLAHVQLLVDRSEAPAFARLPNSGEVGSIPDPHVMLLRHASPAIFTSRLETMPRDPVGGPALLRLVEARWNEDPLEEKRSRSLEPIFRTATKADWQLLAPHLRRMGIDRTSAIAERVYTESPLVAPISSGTQDATFEVVSHHEEPRRIEIVARSSSSGFVRLSYAHDRDIGVFLDGKRAESVPDAIAGGVVLAFPAGLHSIELLAPTFSLRINLLVFSSAIATGLIVVLIRFPTRAAHAG